MSLIVNLQPSSTTAVQYQAGQVLHPPSLLVFDGKSTVMISPAAIAGGLEHSALFGRQLAAAAMAWADGCDALLTAAGASDPLGVDDLLEGLQPDHGGA